MNPPKSPSKTPETKFQGIFFIKLKIKNFNFNFLAQNRALPSIHENNELISNQSIFSWLFQHTSQIIELSLRVLITNQIEKCLKESKLDELKVILNFNNYLFKIFFNRNCRANLQT